jgi:lipid A 3-O-deacylase
MDNTMKPFRYLLAAGMISTQLYADEAELNMALGSFDVGKSGTAMGQLEYQFSNDWSGFRPKAGFFVTADSGAYLYGGVGYPFSISDKWSLTPSLSAGYYKQGAGRDLGYDVEFYSQLRLDYRLASNARLGLGIGHISNAGIGDENPGAETVYLSYSISF